MELNERRLDDGMWMLTVSGEMDMYNAESFKQAIDRLLSDAEVGVIVDFGELAYIDSSGIGALLYSVTQGKSRNTGVCFIKVVGSVRKVIELTSLLGFLPIEDGVEGAVLRLTRS